MKWIAKRIYGADIENYINQGWRVSRLRLIVSTNKVAYIAWRELEETRD